MSPIDRMVDMATGFTPTITTREDFYQRGAKAINALIDAAIVWHNDRRKVNEDHLVVTIQAIMTLEEEFKADK